MAHLTNFSFEFFHKIFTEDASQPLLYHGAIKSKMTKNSNQGGGGSCLKLHEFPLFFFGHGMNHFELEYIWAAWRENRPDAIFDNLLEILVKLQRSCTEPTYCETSNCRILAISKDFMVLCSGSFKLAKGEYFHWKSQNQIFWHQVGFLVRWHIYSCATVTELIGDFCMRRVAEMTQSNLL